MAPGPFCGKRGMADTAGLILPPSKPSPRGRLSRFAPNPHFGFFFFIFCKARRRRVGMCDRREQILPKEGDGRQSRPFFTPFQTFPFGGLSCFAPRGQWSSVSAEFSSPSRSPSVLLPQRQHFPRFSAVVELLFRRILAMGFLDSIVSPVPFHNGSISCISLPLWNFFSAASLLWASWTALPPQSPSTTAAFPAFPCRCGMVFPPHSCYGLPGRHCLSGHLPQRQRNAESAAVAEKIDVLTFQR